VIGAAPFCRILSIDAGLDNKIRQSAAERLFEKLRLRQCGLVHIDIVKSRIERLIRRVLFAELLQAALARDRRAPPAGRIDALREEQGLQMGKACRLHRAAHFADQLHVKQRRFALLHDHAVFGQAIEAVAVKRLAEQAFGRARRVGAVDDDDVDRIRLGVLHPFDAVDEFQIRTRIVVRLAQFREINLGQAGDALVDIDLHRLFDRRMFQDFPQRAAIAAADDPDPFRIRVGIERRMADHLMIKKVVAGGDHRAAVDHHQVAETFGLKDFQILKWRLLFVQLFLDFQRKGRGDAGRFFGKPFVGIDHLRSCKNKRVK